ncbi:DUF3685 domain-containing protein [Leptolyngbya sp. FACHB-321]|uniref:DUF3685 domain-containing protein n=1 Tax=Leptolyngbya sp. FACHB-321 TaxID=2692807 RepID=UPI001688D61F|nr:DUF3685 domain-containing protein [Leptolyngbya sp. FACHB-321]MBD2036749.1 DUF3685 domain-containing protein [Leptolyngbya sp. FACHB-321]
MSHSRDADRQQNRVCRLMLIEDDPVFRLGLAACLQSFDDLQVVLEADSPARALQLLRELPDEMETADRSVAPARSLNLIILNLDLGQTTASQGLGLALCQQLRTQYADTPLLLLGATLELTRLATAFQSGAGGYCLKGTSVTELVTAIRQVASGQPYWTEGIQAIAQSLNTPVPNTTSLTAQTARPLTDRAPQNTLPAISGSQNLLTVWRRNVRESGVRQIERAIAELDDQLQTADRSVLDQLVLEGQRRELRTARWLVKRLLKTSDEPAPELGSQVSLPTDASRSLQPDHRSQAIANPSEPLADERSTALAETIVNDIQSPLTALFQATVAKLQNRLPNLTATALEIDVLKDEKKRELLYTVLRSLQASLEALRLSNLPPEQLEIRHRVILQDIWQATVIDFFGKYYTVQMGTQPIDVVAVLLQDLDIVQTAILDKMPLFPEFLAHLLFQTPLTIDDANYAAGTVEAMARMELLLQNVMLQIANAVMQPLLNRFGDLVAIKQTFYDKRLLSSRDVERFRNDLSWKYRTDRLFAEPTAIFESQFNLLVLTDNGISKTAIYAPRSDELAQLAGLPFLVTLALEARDAIAPRLRIAISFLGRGVVYVLTEVIGRGIGLIGRGMIKGIGNALQDTKPNRNSERWR